MTAILSLLTTTTALADVVFPKVSTNTEEYWYSDGRKIVVK